VECKFLNVLKPCLRNLFLICVFVKTMRNQWPFVRETFSKGHGWGCA